MFILFLCVFKKNTKFDVLVCDMNYIRSEIIELMINCAKKILKSNGIFIVTLKGKKRSWESKPILIEKELNLLNPFFTEIQIIDLLANTKFESTLFCRKI